MNFVFPRRLVLCSLLLKKYRRHFLEIEKNEENMYIVTIANKLGEECVVSVSKGEMDEEDFKIGDIVFLTDEGVLEQAYDKEDE